MARAHYATTTPFYRHVVEALTQNYGSVSLQRRFQLDDRTFRAISPLLWAGARELLERRVQPEVPAAEISTFKRWSFEPALYARLGRRMPVAAYRRLIQSTAKEVRRRASGAEVLQFTDGIGYLALRESTHHLSVMERRHVHHDVLRQPLDTWDGFPVIAEREPIPDVLDEEYSSADAIVVYSEAARQTFLARGFQPHKVFVVHRGASALPTSRPVTRDRNLVVYVGRGDADKGLDVAVGAVQALRGEARLEVAGPLTNSVLSWLSQYDRVKYLGLLNRAELSRLYSRASLLLQPSIESFGLAMTDAASVGLRIICCETAGIGPELGSEFSSVLATRDVNTWAKTISEELAAESDERRYDRSVNGSIQDRFSWLESERAMGAVHRGLG